MLLDDIADYEQWRDEGSVVTSDIFGGTSADFDARIERIFGSALHVVETCKMRRQELEAYGA